jgi:hypothetical protein
MRYPPLWLRRYRDDACAASARRGRRGVLGAERRLQAASLRSSDAMVVVSRCAGGASQARSCDGAHSCLACASAPCAPAVGRLLVRCGSLDMY